MSKIIFCFLSSLFLLTSIQAQSGRVYKIKSVGVIFKVQVGAFSKSIPLNFNDLPELSTYVMPNGMKKYLSGSFDSYEEALLHKKQLVHKGYLGTFIVAFKQGTPIPISSLEIIVNHSLIELINSIKSLSLDSNKTLSKPVNSDLDKLELITAPSQVDSTLAPEDSTLIKQTPPLIRLEDIIFRIKIGEFIDGVPLETMDKFNQLKDLIFIFKGENGSFIYTTGYYKKHVEAENTEAELKLLGIKNTEVVGIYENKILTKQDAINLKLGKIKWLDN